MKRVLLIAWVVLGTADHSVHGAVLPTNVGNSAWGDASSGSAVATPNVSEDDSGSASLPAGGTGLRSAYAYTSLWVQGGTVHAHGTARARFRFSETATTFVEVLNDGEVRRVGGSPLFANNNLVCHCQGTFDVVGPAAPAFIRWFMRAKGQGGDGVFNGGSAFAHINGYPAEIEVDNGVATLWFDGMAQKTGLDVSASGIVAIGNTDGGELSGNASCSASSPVLGGSHLTKYLLNISLTLEK